MFVENAALEAMVTEMARQPWRLPAPQARAHGGHEGDPYRDRLNDGEVRGCPACQGAMVDEQIATVVIDRCATHGLWFDQGELATALANAVEPPKGLGAWLKRVFVDP
ncbi:MAG: zf-TFIIB domain-containing protein [Deltaproteobacteria bacterium]|nr:zf-TFIIB domain-containing protein [Deltaproteobacteria bacterium]MCW5803473.1 zf-TFIIB domain-containing protein [Deltaproteobacteria bacterium]